jgi:hypothetical protein
MATSTPPEDLTPLEQLAELLEEALEMVASDGAEGSLEDVERLCLQAAAAAREARLRVGLTDLS